MTHFSPTRSLVKSVRINPTNSSESEDERDDENLENVNENLQSINEPNHGAFNGKNYIIK